MGEGARGGRVAASAHTLVVRRHVRWQGADQPAALHNSLHLPTSPYISLHLPSISLYLPLSPYQAPTNPLLAGVESAALPAAMEQYLAEVEEAEREEEPLVSKDGVVAPAWYTKAKNTAERKQATEH